MPVCRNILPATPFLMHDACRNLEKANLFALSNTTALGDADLVRQVWNPDVPAANCRKVLSFADDVLLEEKSINLSCWADISRSIDSGWIDVGGPRR